MQVVAAPWVLLGAPPSIAAGEAPGEEVRPGSLADGAVALDGDRLVEVGPRARIEARHGRAERLDAVLLPALVNAHLHLELSHLEGRVPGGRGLAAWIELLVAARMKAPGVDEAMASAAASLRRAGVAAVGDVGNTLGALRHLGREGIAGTLYHEVFGFGADRARAALAAAAEMRERAGPPPPGLRVAPSPHAVYSTHPRVLGDLLSAGPASVHLAEDPGERAFCARAEGAFAELSRRLGAGDLQPLGRSAVACAAPHLHRESLAVHLVDLDAFDLAALRSSGATAVLCPRSNAHIGGRLPDLPRLLEAGVPLAVGTDSLASAPSLSPLAELAALARAFPQVSLERLAALAWNGAAVGAPGVGRLTPGAAPGILAASLAGAAAPDPFRFLLDFGAEERPFTWIARHRPEA